MLETHIVAHRRNDSDVIREIRSRQRGAPGRDGMLKLHGNVGGVATGAAIAHREKTTAATINASYGTGRRQDAVTVVCEEALLHCDTLPRLQLHRLEQGRVKGARRIATAGKEGIQSRQGGVFELLR